MLTHYDQSKPIIVHCDASPYGVGAVLSHLIDDGSEKIEKPVSFCSGTLSKAELNYTHIEKEGLALLPSCGETPNPGASPDDPEISQLICI